MAEAVAQPGAWLLAIDSSTEQAGVALFDGARLGELSWPAGRTQTTSVLGQVHHLLELHGLAVADLGAVAVGVGPGTFNGLRVGLSLAKGLALGLGVPLVGVPTLAAAALPHALGGGSVVPVVAAGRGRIVWATYGRGPAGWTELAPPRNGTAEELAEQLRAAPGAVVTGELTPDQEATVAGAGAVVPPAALRGRRPAAVAELGWRRWRAGDVDDLAALAPAYLGR
jgi:tRNA threonylcarbamoyladenosine biosynthesis protein TsaB